MKRSLKEQLDRIYELTHGKKHISEQQTYTDRLKNFVGLDGSPSTSQKYDDPKKADYLSTDVNDLFKTIQAAAQAGGLKQQPFHSMIYQKEVESMQVGLVLLGFPLPLHGVDGLFGPETASAVQKFDKTNNVVNESSKELRMSLSSLGNSEKGNEISSGGEISDQLSNIVNIILKDFKQSNPNVKVTVTAGNDLYHQNLGYPSKHKMGQAVDLTLSPSDSDIKKAFENLCNSYEQKDHNLKVINEYDHPSGAATGPHFHIEYGTGGVPQNNVKKNLTGDGQNISGIAATPNMLNKLGELLKQRGVKPEELTKLIDPVISGGGGLFTDLDLTSEQDYVKYGKICQKFINIKNPNSDIRGEMLASAAKHVYQQYHKYIPPELALAQLAQESGVNSNPLSRPVRTRNPFNVGNTATKSETFPSVQEGINAYYQLIAKDYLGKGKSASDLLNNFVNHDNQNYIGPDNGKKYELDLNRLAREANNVAKSIT